MAKITKVTMVDDLDGTQSDDVREVRFSLGDRSYAIDLTPQNEESLTAALQPFIDAARRQDRKTRSSGTKVVRNRPRAEAGDRQPSASTIRAWAMANGIEVGERGRLHQSVRQQYLDAHAG